MKRTLLIFGSLFGLIAVALGAFGAHFLEKLLEADKLGTFETGVKYQMYHALLMMFLGISNVFSKKTLRVVAVLLITGTMLFSGSIYFLATNSLTSFDFRSIGFITPVGGSLLILGWAFLCIRLITNKAE